MANSRNRRTTEAPTVAVRAAEVLDRHLNRGQRVVAALSGGVDSVVLLHILNAALPGYGCTLAALHVHHGLSPNADAWQRFCADLCADWRIPFAVARVDVPDRSGLGLEAAARQARHRVFQAADADWVALAHHRGDQAETLLFNLLRGCGVAGAAAMAHASDHRLLRPLLDVPRADIVAYANERKLRWIEDESNVDTRYSRNFLRHDVLTLLASRFPAAEANLAAAARRFGEAAELLDDLARLDLGDAAEDFPLPVAVMRGLDERRGRNLLRYLLGRRGVQIPGAARLAEACRQLTAAAPDRHPALEFGAWRLYRTGDQIFLTDCAAAPPVPPPT